MIHILDYKTEKIVGTLENKEDTSLFWLDNHKQSLKDNIETFDFTMQANVKESEYVSKRNRIIISDEDGFFREFIIFEAKQYSDLTKEVYTNGSYTDLKKQKVIEPTTLDNQTISNAGQFVLSDTSYQVGIIEISGTRKIVFENYTDALNALQIIASSFNCELRFRVEVKGNRIIGRYVDFLQQVGGKNGKETELGKDLIGITRKENTDSIVTALIVLGPEKEDGTRAVVTVKDEDALQRWADKDNRHLWDIYEPQVDQDVTEERLTELGRNELNKRINSLIEYTVDAASIEHIFGYEHEKVRLGDTTRIKDTSFEPALYVEARVIEVDRSISDPSAKSYVLGDFIEYSEEDIMARFKKLQAILQQKVSSGEITAIREYVDQQDQANYEDSTHYADVVSETAKNNAVNESINYIDNQVSQVEETIERVEQEVRQREIQVYKQDTAPSGTDFIVGQLWIRTTDNAFHKWDGTKWVKFLPTMQELAEKAGLEYVNGELINKANKADTYTKTEVNNALNGKVSTTTYTTDMNGVVQNLSNLETKVSQTEKAITFLATKDELNAITGEIKSINSELSIHAGKIESAVTKTELENLTIGFRNLLRATSDSDKSFSFSGWQHVGEQVTAYGLSELSKGGLFTLSAEITKNTAGSTKIGLMLHLNKSDGTYKQYTNVNDALNALQTGKIESTFNIPVDTYTSGFIYIRHYAATDPVSTGAYAKAKLEKGSKATDWQKAPEDYEVDISSLGTKITNAESRITQTEKDITSKVSTTTYNTDVNGLKSRMESAESSITQQAGQISSKVEKTDYTGAKVVSMINQTADTVKIQAKNIDLVGQVIASHIKSLNGLNVGNGQFVVDANGNVSFKGTLNGATGTFSGKVTTTMLEVGVNGGVPSIALKDLDTGTSTFIGHSLSSNDPEGTVWFRNIAGTNVNSILPLTLKITGNLSVDGRTNFNNNGIDDVNTIYVSNWYRSEGNTGWYNETYGGGIYMTDTADVRVYNGKNFRVDGLLKAYKGADINGAVTLDTALNKLAHATLPLTNGWTHYNTVNYIGASYTKSVDGFVHLRGMVSGGAVGTVIGVLPVGCRPLRTEPIIVLTSSGFGRIDILENGYVKLVSGGTGWVSLSSVVFLAEN